MSFVINNNNAANYNLIYNKINTNKINKALEELSTGRRINRAADDSAGLVIADQLMTQSNGLIQGNKNANDAIGLVKIADSALEEYQNILQKAREKAIQAASDTASDDARNALENDVKELLKVADSIATKTQYNGINLLDGSFTNKSFHVGSNANDVITMSISSVKIADQNIDDTNIDLTTQSGAESAITSLDTAIKNIDNIRSSIGSTQSALESRVRVNNMVQVNVKAAESQIRDADLSKVQDDLNKYNIIQQASTFALQQSFQSQQLVLNLLR